MEWIKDKIPENRQQILMLTQNGLMLCGWFDFDNYEFPYGFHINGSSGYEDPNQHEMICWTPLPNQPERLSEKTSKEDAIV